MEIIERIPIHKTLERVKFSNGTEKHRCYSLSNPHYYTTYNELQPIQLDHQESVKLKSNEDAQISRRNVTSVGIKKGGNKFKFLGLRPDNNQHLGNEQLEFTIETIELDGINEDIKLNKCDNIDAITTDLGSMVIQSNRQWTRQLIKSPNVKNDFKIVYKLHLTGLYIRNDLISFVDETIRPSTEGMSEVKVSGKFYQPNDQGNFIITDSTNNVKFVISKPILIDSAFNILSDETLHTLQLTPKGELEYIKYADSGCKDELSKSSYIDADIYYAEATDGIVKGGGATWPNAHGKTDGYATVTGDYLNTIAAYYFSGFYIWRAFFMFDTDGITYTPSSCKLHIHGATDVYNRDGVSVQQGTQGDTLVNADFDAFSGSYFDYIAAWNQLEYNVFTFNPTGVAAINKTGLTKLCVREYVHDYLNATPGAAWQRLNMYFSDNTGIDKDPYLEIGGRPYFASPSQKTVIFG